MQAASGLLTRLHYLGPGMKALFAGLMGFGYSAAEIGFFATAASGIGLSGLGFGLTGTTPNYGYLVLGLLLFYGGCVGLGLLNTATRRALRIGLIGVLSAVLAWPLITGIVGPIVTGLDVQGCSECQLLRNLFTYLGFLVPGFVPAIVILYLSTPMNQARWRGMGFGLLLSPLIVWVFSAIVGYWRFSQIAITPSLAVDFSFLFWIPFAWALITYGTLRAKDNPAGG